jgi:putative heme-binding domain-containing protein
MPSNYWQQCGAFDLQRSVHFRNRAFEYLGGSWGGEDLILGYLKEGIIDKAFIPSAVQGVSKAWRKQVSREAYKYLGNPESKTANKMPVIADLVAMKGDATKGIILFQDYCSTCHQVKNEGVDFGPKLSNIGAKLSKEGQYLAILHPDAGISFGYEGWEIKTKDGATSVGIITSSTENDLHLKAIGGTIQTIKTKDIKSKKMLEHSLMTAGFHEVLKPEELSNLVAYLMNLK